MKLTVSPLSPFLVRVWMPGLFVVMTCLFFHGMALQFWLLAVPPLLIATFMSTLAEVHDEGQRVHIKTLWSSMDVSKQDVVKTSRSFLEGIDVLHLRRFVPPWGRIYFVTDWSKTAIADAGRGKESTTSGTKSYLIIRATLESLVVALSGFFAARAIGASVRDFSIATYTARALALLSAGGLCILFAVVQRKKPSFANVALFVAAALVGLVHW